MVVSVDSVRSPGGTHAKGAFIKAKQSRSLHNCQARKIRGQDWDLAPLFQEPLDTLLDIRVRTKTTDKQGGFDPLAGGEQIHLSQMLKSGAKNFLEQLLNSMAIALQHPL